MTLLFLGPHSDSHEHTEIDFIKVSKDHYIAKFTGQFLIFLSNLSVAQWKFYSNVTFS